jgi:hypothetical protein
MDRCRYSRFHWNSIPGHLQPVACRYPARNVSIHVNYFHGMMEASEGRVAESAEFSGAEPPTLFVAIGLPSAGCEFSF